MPMLVYSIGTLFGTERWNLQTGVVLVVVVGGVLTASYGGFSPHQQPLVHIAATWRQIVMDGLRQYQWQDAAAAVGQAGRPCT
jgi:hypothetical protein